MSAGGGASRARCFVGVRLPAAAPQIALWLNELARTRAEVRWVRPVNVHLTVKFIGDVARERIDAVVAALREVRFAPFALGIDGLGQFPPRGRPRVLWAGVGGDVRALTALAEAIDDRLAALGFARETRPFRAHVTLGRVRGPGGLAALPAALQRLAARTAPEPVAQFVLFASEQRPEGPRYGELAAVTAAD
ncbi:MAG: RNA 2',3'-cyclic phosphodiesterase [Planctomycetota bacterium]